jgi:hypothetical protein
MSITAHYARLSRIQLEEWKDAVTEDPERYLKSIKDTEMIDIAQSWGPIAWLVSRAKRLEDRHNWRVMKEPGFRDVKKNRGSSLLQRLGFRKEELSPLRKSLAELDAIEIDAPLKAIEGRSEITVDRLDFGMGPAALFENSQVVALSQALGTISADSFYQQLKPTEMDEVGVYPGTWRGEAFDLLESFVLPNFVRLQEFYKAAAASGQCVLVWYQ